MRRHPTSPEPSSTGRTRTRRRGSRIALVTLALLAAGCGRSTAAEPSRQPVGDEPSTTVVRPSMPVDDLVAVDGARLHVSCTGSGDVTVVLISGFLDGGEKWSSVTPSVSRRARVCSYARFGDGTSDPPPGTQTFATEAKDLREALRSIDEPGPFLLVGHSFGGAEAATIGSLGSVPMTVITAARHPYPGLAAVEEARLAEVWDAGQRHWTSLSSSGQLMAVDNTSHDIQLDRPDVVIEQIQRLLP